MTDRRAHLLLLLVIVFWAGNFPLGKLALDELGPVAITAGRALVAAPVLVLVARLTAPLGWAVIRYGAVLVTLAHVWYYAIVRTLGPGRAAGFLNLMPFVVLGLAWLLVGEAIHAYHPIGAALLIAGVFLTMRRAD